EDTAVEASSTEHGFALRLHSGAEHVGRRVILATGVVDELPAIPGITERWGKTIFHCPYCHGYELDQGRIGVLATTALSIHAAIMLPDWGPTTYFTQGIFEPEDDKLPALERRHVGIEREPVTHIGGEGRVVEVHLRDGRVISLDGLFLLPKTRIASPIPAQLGCELDDGPHGTFLKTDPMKETSVRGVFACGDAALPAGSVAFAVGDGARAGIAAHQSLVFR
ncbi:MAG TPA: NAD(P)/FAD-dependent oxidoreductase, partial [Labilithrix sp.]|nr:NAD(P)/FAD-dependent oxidoreductase [Labilithrix sp.]